MSARPSGGGLAFVARFLVAYRLLFYLGGLLAISTPLGLAWVFDIELAPAARTAIVGVSFAVLLATYLAERRVGLNHVDPATGAPREAYSLRLRVSVVLALAGLAIGTFLLLDGRPGPGLLFGAGALLFFQLAYRAERGGEGTGEDGRAS